MQNCGAEHQETMDQRKSSAMEDSTAMTIDFLRARLLSERSVSRSARQRAEQLAKKVMELEERNKIVSIQRKKAEKALAEVLAVLDSHGISEFSEGFDSNSDQEGILDESKESNGSVKEGEHSMNSNLRKSEAEDGLSGSEPEVSPSLVRSLSWKRGTDTPKPREKNFSQDSQRHHSFVSSSRSSEKQRSGKSCRQIKRGETRSAGEDVRDSPPLLDAQENGMATGSRSLSNSLEDRPEIVNGGFMKKQEVSLEVPVSCCLEDRRKENGIVPHANGSDRVSEMEQALEQQAQLIGRYEAEENAQREWEEKFRENNAHALDSYEPGNQSDVTEERNEPKAEAAEPVYTTPCLNAAELGPSITANEHGSKLNTHETQNGKDPTIRTPNSAFVSVDPTSHERISSPTGKESLLVQHHSRIPADGFDSGFQGLAYQGSQVDMESLPGQQRSRTPMDGFGVGLQGPAFPGPCADVGSLTGQQGNRMAPSGFEIGFQGHAFPGSGAEGESFLGLQHSRTLVNKNETGFQGLAFSGHEHIAGMKGKQSMELPGNSSNAGLLGDLKFGPLTYGSLRSHSARLPSPFQSGGDFSKGERSGSQNHLLGVPHLTSSDLGKGDGKFSGGGEISRNQKQLVVAPHQTSSNLGGVLESLQFAKEMLQHKLKNPPPSSQGTIVATLDSQLPAGVNAVDVPIGSTSLFRLPTKLQSNTSRTDLSSAYTNYGSNYTWHGLDSGSGVTSGNSFPNLHIESRSRITSGQPQFNNYLDPVMGMSAASRNSYPYTDFRTGLPSNDGFHRS